MTGRKRLELLSVLLFASGLFGQQVRVSLPPTESEIGGVCLSPDGGYLAATSLDFTVRIWDVSSGGFLRSLVGHSMWPKVCAMSDHGVMASGSDGGEIIVWDINDGSILRRLLAPTDVGMNRELALSDERVLKRRQESAENMVHRDFAYRYLADENFIVTRRPVVFIDLYDNQQELVAVYRNKDNWSLVTWDWQRSLMSSISTLVRAPTFVKLAGRFFVVGYPEYTVALDESGTEIARMFCQNARPASPVRSDPFYIYCPGEGLRSWRLAAGGQIESLNIYTTGATEAVIDARQLSVAALAYLDGTIEIQGPTAAKVHVPSPPRSPLGFTRDGRLIAVEKKTASQNVGIWDRRSPEPLHTFSLQGSLPELEDMALSPDGSLLVTGFLDGGFCVWDLRMGRVVSRVAIPGRVRTVAFSPGGLFLALAGDDTQIWIYETATWRPFRLTLSASSMKFGQLLFFNDTRLLVRRASNSFDVFDLESGRTTPLDGAHLQTFQSVVTKRGEILTRHVGRQLSIRRSLVESARPAFSPTSRPMRSLSSIGSWMTTIGALAESPDGSLVLVAEGGELSLLSRVDTSFAVLTEMNVPDDIVSAAFNKSGSVAALGSMHGTLYFLDVATRKLYTDVVKVGNRSIPRIAWDIDHNFLYAASSEGVVYVIDPGIRLPVLTMLAYREKGWATVSNRGDFDTDTFVDSPIAFVGAANPLSAMPMDWFIRDHFSPLLLPRTLKGEALASKSLPSRRPIPPSVDILDARVDSVGTTVSVRVGVESSTGENCPSEVRLLRDNALVGASRDVACHKGTSLTFAGIKMPASGSASFSAFAFSRDGVKGRASTLKVELPAQFTSKPRAHILAIGVSTIASSQSWNLMYADADAHSMAGHLFTHLAAQRQYSLLTPTVLTTDVPSNAPTKQKVLNALAEIARDSGPDDLAIVTFSGHGVLGRDSYYLLLSDATLQDADSETDLRTGLSTDELKDAFEAIDARRIVLILDSCQSASSVASPGFRAGPLALRTFAQLAFDKRMTVLAAAQPSSLAWESDERKLGLLTGVLLIDGIDRFQADTAPRDNRILLDEWLNFGVSETPRALERSAASRGVKLPERTKRSQQPMLFMFYNGDHNPTIAIR